MDWHSVVVSDYPMNQNFSHTSSDLKEAFCNDFTAIFQTFLFVQPHNSLHSEIFDSYSAALFLFAFPIALAIIGVDQSFVEKELSSFVRAAR